MYRSQLRWQLVVIMLCLATLWGANMAAMPSLGELIQPGLLLALILVSAGWILVNRSPGDAPERVPPV